MNPDAGVRDPACGPDACCPDVRFADPRSMAAGRAIRRMRRRREA